MSVLMSQWAQLGMLSASIRNTLTACSAERPSCPRKMTEKFRVIPIDRADSY